MESENFIANLIEQTRQIINEIESLKKLDNDTLNWKLSSQSWNILECIEHLNLYGDYYLPEISSSIHNAKASKGAAFKSGFLGGYFAKSMLPKERLNKMKTFASKNPINQKLERNVIIRCLSQQIQLVELLNQSRNVSLNKAKVKISIARWVKINLGDTFQFVINHNLRHLRQIRNIQLAKQNSI
jgi:hypothetical protein